MPSTCCMHVVALPQTHNPGWQHKVGYWAAALATVCLHTSESAEGSLACDIFHMLPASFLYDWLCT